MNRLFAAVELTPIYAQTHIIGSMSSASAFDWVERSLRPDRTDPYLRIQFVPVFVRDLDRSIQFFVERLGFKVISEARPTQAERRIAVAPPDGTALLSLRAPDAESREYQRIGRSGPVVFLTDDVKNKFDEWSSRGVHFRQPVQIAGEGRPFYADFEDLDGNSFTLTGIDELTRAFDERRRALTEKEEADRRTALELEIAKQVQSRLWVLLPECIPSTGTRHRRRLPVKLDRGILPRSGNLWLIQRITHVG